MAIILEFPRLPNKCIIGIVEVEEMTGGTEAMERRK
jgi:hypothetical protein